MSWFKYFNKNLHIEKTEKSETIEGMIQSEHDWIRTQLIEMIENVEQQGLQIAYIFISYENFLTLRDIVSSMIKEDFRKEGTQITEDFDMLYLRPLRFFDHIVLVNPNSSFLVRDEVFFVLRGEGRRFRIKPMKS